MKSVEFEIQFKNLCDTKIGNSWKLFKVTAIASNNCNLYDLHAPGLLSFNSRASQINWHSSQTALRQPI
jgi:hypothetical protein